LAETATLPFALWEALVPGADVVWLVVFELEPQAAARRAANGMIAIRMDFLMRTPSGLLKADPDNEKLLRPA
jgi:hypothetical protein